MVSHMYLLAYDHCTMVHGYCTILHSRLTATSDQKTCAQTLVSSVTAWSRLRLLPRYSRSEQHTTDAKIQPLRTMHHCQPTTCAKYEKLHLNMFKSGMFTKKNRIYRGVALPGGLKPPPVHGGYTGVPCTVPPAPARDEVFCNCCIASTRRVRHCAQQQSQRAPVRMPLLPTLFSVTSFQQVTCRQ